MLEQGTVDRHNDSGIKVGYKTPPVHSRFKPGVSGNPAGRLKGRKKLGELFQQILNEQVFLREGESVKRISKAEAALRTMVLGALKGDARSLDMLLRVAEHTGELRNDSDSLVVTVQRFGQPVIPDAA